jgi:hypothetical protein
MRSHRLAHDSDTDEAYFCHLRFPLLLARSVMSDRQCHAPASPVSRVAFASLVDRDLF